MPQAPRTIVVDASVVLKWQLDDEEYVPQAVAIREDFYIRGATKAIAPHLIIYEIVNGMVAATKRRRIKADRALDAINNLLVLGVELKEIEPCRVLQLALEYGLTAYDAAYLALAELENCELWTGDKAFYQSARKSPILLRWLGDYASEASS